MLKTTSWVWIATAAVIGIGSMFAFTPNAVPVANKSQPKEKEEKPEDEWLPVRNLPQTAFPALAPPAPVADRKEQRGREEKLDALCPRLTGGLKIDAADGALQKLLKARLHQGAVEIQRFRDRLELGFPDRTDRLVVRDALNDMLAATTELFARQPKELVPLLEELVIMSKEIERVHLLRARADDGTPLDWNAASRIRLKVEAELWKAKNAK